MSHLQWYEPDVPQRLDAPWLQVAVGDQLYAPCLVRIRKRQFSTEMIRTLDLARHTHAHRIYHLIYYLRGANSILVGDQVVDVHAGQMVLIDPDVRHNVVPREPRDCSFLTLMFSYQSSGNCLSLPFEQLLERLLGHRLQLAPVVDDSSGRLQEFFGHLESEVLEQREKDLWRVSFCLAGLFSALQGISLRRNPLPLIPDDMLAVQRYLGENLLRPVSIDELTQISHLSRSRLIDKFRQYYGTSPIDYLIQGRIEKAKVYLQHSSKRIKEIATLCGFQSEYYFCKTFRKRTQQTPGQFRQSSRDGHAGD